MHHETHKDVFAAASLSIATVRRFNEAFGRQDLDATMALLSEDCVFENTHPAPDGTRHEGQDAVRRAFATFFEASPRAKYKVEELFAAGDRCVVRWVYWWVDDLGQRGHVRGVDLFRMRDGLIAEKLSYVKG